MRNQRRMDEEFLKRRIREQLIAIAKETGLADGHSLLGSWKKAELVSALLRHAEQARSAAEPTEAQIRARAWLPGAMMFPAIDPDRTETAADHRDAGHDDRDDDGADGEGDDAGDDDDGSDDHGIYDHADGH